MTVPPGSDETKVGMARCAVPTAFSVGTLHARGPRTYHSVKRQFRACTARGRRSAASLPPLPREISGLSTAKESPVAINVGSADLG
jgi:hypothetical protein